MDTLTVNICTSEWQHIVQKPFYSPLETDQNFTDWGKGILKLGSIICCRVNVQKAAHKWQREFMDVWGPYVPNITEVKGQGSKIKIHKWAGLYQHVSTMPLIG